eukprot:6212304-Pleurochrysis_carterae.AAC.3
MAGTAPAELPPRRARRSRAATQPPGKAHLQAWIRIAEHAGSICGALQARSLAHAPKLHAHTSKKIDALMQAALHAQHF